MRLWTQCIRIDLEDKNEEFKNVHLEEIQYETITPGIKNLLKDHVGGDQRNIADYPRGINDSPNFNRPPVSESLIEILFSSDLPVVRETMVFLDAMLKEELAAQNEMEEVLPKTHTSIFKEQREKTESTEERDSHIESGFINANVHHLPSVKSNPSSLQGARDNLQHIAVCSGLRGFVEEGKVQRNNVLLYEDGGGYAPTYKTIVNSYWDSICKQAFDSKEDFIDHWLKHHKDNGIENLDDYRQFKDILVLSGGGHYEMNARKSFLADDLTYENIVKPVMLATGFSPIQCKYQSNSNDNHK